MGIFRDVPRQARTGALKSAAEVKCAPSRTIASLRIAAVARRREVPLRRRPRSPRPCSGIAKTGHFRGPGSPEQRQGRPDRRVTPELVPGRPAARPSRRGSHGPTIGRPKSSRRMISQFDRAVSSMSSTSAGAGHAGGSAGEPTPGLRGDFGDVAVIGARAAIGQRRGRRDADIGRLSRDGDERRCCRCLPVPPAGRQRRPRGRPRGQRRPASRPTAAKRRHVRPPRRLCSDNTRLAGFRRAWRSALRSVPMLFVALASPYRSGWSHRRWRIRAREAAAEEPGGGAPSPPAVVSRPAVRTIGAESKNFADDNPIDLRSKE